MIIECIYLSCRVLLIEVNIFSSISDASYIVLSSFFLFLKPILSKKDTLNKGSIYSINHILTNILYPYIDLYEKVQPSPSLTESFYAHSFPSSLALQQVVYVALSTLNPFFFFPRSPSNTFSFPPDPLLLIF